MSRLGALLLTTLCAAATLPEAHAQARRGTATAMIASCRASLTEEETDAPYDVGFCQGVLAGVIETSPSICAPRGSTYNQAMRLVVTFLDRRQGRWNEMFSKLALEALSVAWPCR